MLDIELQRKNKRLSQEQLAKKIGVHQTAVSQWEKGTTQPCASRIPKLLKALDCKIEDIYREEEREDARKNNLDDKGNR